MNCSQWLDRELELIQPEVVILLGKVAALSFLARYSNERAEAVVGRAYDVQIKGKPATAFRVYHPSYRRRKPALVDASYASIATLINRTLNT